MLETLKNRVEERVSESTDKIVMGMYQKIIDTHNDFCGCDYCVLLNEYVNKRKYLSKLNQHIDLIEFDTYNGYMISDVMLSLGYVKEEIKVLKQKKDNIKKIALGYNHT